jgi:hypothetical protein
MDLDFFQIHSVATVTHFVAVLPCLCHTFFNHKKCSHINNATILIAPLCNLSAARIIGSFTNLCQTNYVRQRNTAMHFLTIVIKILLKSLHEVCYKIPAFLQKNSLMYIWQTLLCCHAIQRRRKIAFFSSFLPFFCHQKLKGKQALR